MIDNFSDSCLDLLVKCSGTEHNVSVAYSAEKGKFFVVDSDCDYLGSLASIAECYCQDYDKRILFSSRKKMGFRTVNHIIDVLNGINFHDLYGFLRNSRVGLYGRLLESLYYDDTNIANYALGVMDKLMSKYKDYSGILLALLAESDLLGPVRKNYYVMDTNVKDYDVQCFYDVFDKLSEIGDRFCKSLSEEDVIIFIKIFMESLGRNDYYQLINYLLAISLLPKARKYVSMIFDEVVNFNSSIKFAEKIVEAVRISVDNGEEIYVLPLLLVFSQPYYTSNPRVEYCFDSEIYYAAAKEHAVPIFRKFFDRVAHLLPYPKSVYESRHKNEYSTLGVYKYFVSCFDSSSLTRAIFSGFVNWEYILNNTVWLLGTKFSNEGCYISKTNYAGCCISSLKLLSRLENKAHCLGDIENIPSPTNCVCTGNLQYYLFCISCELVYTYKHEFDVKSFIDGIAELKMYWYLYFMSKIFKYGGCIDMSNYCRDKIDSKYLAMQDKYYFTSILMYYSSLRWCLDFSDIKDKICHIGCPFGTIIL